MRITYNSRQPQQRHQTHRSRSSSHSQNGTEHQRTALDTTKAISSSSKPLASNPEDPWPPTRRLIANPRLKFTLTNRKLSPLRISNRERMPNFFSALRLAFLPLLATNHSTLPTGFLIVTLELNFPATRRKLTANPVSNRYKSHFLKCARHSARAVLRSQIPPAMPSVGDLTQPLTRTSIVRLPRPKILDRGAFRKKHLVRSNS